MHTRQRGLSLIELMVGMAIGLVLTAITLAATTLHLRENQRLLVDARLMQDLRTVTDLLARDLRRAATLTATADGVQITHAGSSEELSYRLRGGVIEMKIGSGHWQAMTDATTVRISSLHIAPHTHEAMLDGFCSRPCADGSSHCPPRQLRRTVDVRIVAQPAQSTGSTRNTTSTAQLRHDALIGACPA
jgi:type IV pilus assembly protein PilW